MLCCGSGGLKPILKSIPIEHGFDRLNLCNLRSPYGSHNMPIGWAIDPKLAIEFQSLFTCIQLLGVNSTGLSPVANQG